MKIRVMKFLITQPSHNSRVHPSFAALTLNPSPRAGEGLLPPPPPPFVGGGRAFFPRAQRTREAGVGG